MILSQTSSGPDNDPPNALQSASPLFERIRQAVSTTPLTEITFWSAERPIVETTTSIALEAGEQLASALQGLGLEPGDTLAVHVPAWHEHLLLLLASCRLGLRYLPVVYSNGPTELSFMLRQSRAKVLVVPERWRNVDYIERVNALDELPDLRTIVVIGQRRCTIDTVQWSELSQQRAATGLPGLDVGAAFRALVYTSGTTAAPKGAIHGAAGLIAEVLSTLAFMLGERPALLSCHVAGHIGAIHTMLRPFLVGLHVVMLDQWNAQIAVDLVRSKHLTLAIGARYFMQSLLETPGADLSNIRCIVTGGENVSPDLVQRAEQFGIRACRSFGSTEHPTATCSDPADSLQERMYTDGKPMPGCEIRIVNDDGTLLPPGAAGEILTRGPDLFIGYLDDALNRDAFTPDGWFRTGDIGVLDHNGALTVVDRKKDIIIRGGENISSREVEEILATHPSVLQAAAVAWPDPKYGERVAAVVRLKADAQLTLADVLAHFAASGIARQKTPEKLIVIDEMPCGPNGKVLKSELRRRLHAKS